MFLLLTLVFYEQNTNLNHMTSSKKAATFPLPLRLFNSKLQTKIFRMTVLTAADGNGCQKTSNVVKLRFYMKIAGE